MTTLTGISHIATNTPDLERFRRFYEGVLGLRMALTARLDHPPYLRHAALFVTDGVIIHVFEVPGYDPQADGIGTEIGHRGRIDHFGLMVADEEALEALAARCAAAGASDGEIRRFGPYLSVYVEDPDGLALEINCLRQDLDAVANELGEVEEIGVEDWLERLVAANDAAAALSA